MPEFQKLYKQVYQHQPEGLKIRLSAETSYRIRILGQIEEVPMMVFLGAIITDAVTRLWIEYGLDQSITRRE